MVENIVIIGSGCAGLAAAVYTAREGFNPLVIAGSQRGGQLILTTTVENYPGFPNGIKGPELMLYVEKQAVKFGKRIVNENVIEIDTSSSIFKVKTDSNTYETKSIIVATGASSKLLNIPSESKYFGRGVSTCGTCDGPFFKNKDVVVIGGGDTAMEDALFLTKFAKSVTIVHRRDVFRASKVMQDRVMSNSKIKILWNSAVEEILGDGKIVNGIRIKNVVNNQISEMPINGVFVTIGYIPNTSFLQGKLKLDKDGYIVTKDEVLTDIKGVFVAGDVSDRFYRQAATASGSGVKAALHVREYLTNLL